MILLIFTIFNFFLATENPQHPVHISVTNIEYVDSTQKFDISIRLFLDDFENIVSQKYGKNLFLGKENEIPEAKDLIMKYLNEHFKIFVNKTQKTLKFNEKKIIDIELWLYLETEEKNFVKNCEIFNSLYTDLYFDQTNLLIFSYQHFQKPMRFDNNILTTTFEL